MKKVLTRLPVSMQTMVLLGRLATQRGLATSEYFEALLNLPQDKPIAIEQATAIGKLANAEVLAFELNIDELSQLPEASPYIFTNHQNEPVFLLGQVSPTEETQNPQLTYQFLVNDPATDEVKEKFETKLDVEKWWSGIAFIIKEEKGVASKASFGLSWFFHQVISRPSLAAALALTTFVIHGIGLSIPLFFQAVIDKVLVNETVNTLQALAIGVSIAIIFGALLKFFREYMISHLAAKIDILTASMTFQHLLSLPLGYFGRNTAGVITNNMQQGDEIRNFVTGRFLGALIETSAMVVFLPVLLIYSVQLTGIVVVTGLIMAGIIMALTKPYFKILLHLYGLEGVKKTLLVETIHGISTVKSLALEQHRIKQWIETSVEAVHRGFSLRKISAIGASSIGAIEHLSSVAVLYVGVYSVLHGTLSVGALIAFRMLSEQVTDPLRNIVEMVHEFQRTRLAARMLGNIMNEPAERRAVRAAELTEVQGEIIFDQVSFTFPQASRPAIKNVSFRILPGEVIGIVGHSGSGKSTIARLLQGLYQIQSGQIKIDGININGLELRGLRRTVGVVLQDNFLFRGSIADNIAMTQPNTTLKNIQYAAVMSGAAEFIEQLPDAYQSPIEENGSNLSGGQKQRIAIARTLLRDPPILIFDEATSALDVESEHLIQEKMEPITEGRTTIIIAHRLSTLKSVKRVMVMEDGQLIDFRSIPELLHRKNGSETFKRLWSLQAGEQLEGQR